MSSSSALQIPSHRVAYTFQTPSYPPSSVLHRSLLPYSAPAPGQLAIQIHAMSLNPVDTQVIGFTKPWEWFGGRDETERGVGRKYGAERRMHDELELTPLASPPLPISRSALL